MVELCIIIEENNKITYGKRTTFLLPYVKHNEIKETI